MIAKRRILWPPWRNFAEKVLSHTTSTTFDSGYRLLRLMEGRLRLMNATTRDRLPTDPTELNKLAHLVRYPSAEALARRMNRRRGRFAGTVRRVFLVATEG